MTQPQARVRWVIWLATGAAVTVLGLFLFAVGLDDADKYASVIGALGTVAGLGLSLSALIRRSPQEVLPPEESGAATGQQIQASAIGGDAVQVRGVRGNVRVGRAPTPPRQPSVPQTPGEATPPASPGAQSMTNAQIGGSSAQIDQVAGDVDIERGT